MDKKFTRLQWLTQEYGSKLSDLISKQSNVRVDEASAVEQLAAFDPSRNHRFTGWMVECFLRKGFRFEDLSRVKTTLASFLRYQRKLDMPARDIRRYETLADLWIAVMPFVESNAKASNKEVRREDQQKAWNESLVVCRTDTLTAVVPISLFAAKWWGRGTQWCTAADNDNAFGYYHSRGPLIVLSFSDGTKWQMFAGDDDFQLMDENDRYVQTEAVEQRWDDVKPFIDYIFQKHVDAFELIPSHGVTEEHCRLAVSRAGLKFHDLPEHFQTDELRELAIRQSPHTILMMPQRHITEKLLNVFAQAASQDLLSLVSLAKKHPDRLTPQLIKAVLKAPGLAKLNWLRETIGPDCPPGKKPDDLLPMTRELAREIVIANGYNYPQLPKELQTRDLMLLALSTAPVLCEDIPRNLLDEEAWLTAFKADPNVIRLMPFEMQTPERLNDAVRRQGTLISELSERVIPLETAKGAVRTYPQLVELGYKSRFWIKEAVSVYPKAAIYAYEEDKVDPAFRREVVALNPDVLEYEPYRNELSLFDIALSIKPSALQYLPDTPEARAYANLKIKERPSLFQHVPDDFIEEESVLAALKHDLSLCRYIKGDMITEKVAEAINGIPTDAWNIKFHELKDFVDRRFSADLPGPAFAA